ncbi:MAG: homoserine kinase [Gammaproteobacteria bacterium]|nr:homoserine kinase [Gammaproteobacteria bacterium]
MSVYTSLTWAELLDFSHGYDIGQLDSFTGIHSGIINTNFQLQTTRDKYVLTIFERLSSEQVRYFLQLKQFLYQQGLPIALPIANHHGQLVTTLKGKPAALIQFQPGRSIFSVSPQQAFAVGAVLAQLHLACRDFPAGPESNLRGLKWMKRSFQALGGQIDGTQRALIQTELDFQAHHWVDDLPGGVIHGDLFRDNCLMLGDQVSAVLDWYAASVDHWLFDLAICINDWCGDHEGSLEANLVDAMLAGYQSVRPLTNAEQQAFDWALRRAALRFYLSRLLDMHNPQPGELTHIKDPEEFGRLLRHFRDQTIAA